MWTLYCLELIYCIKSFQSRKKFPFQAIQNGSKSNKMPQAWTEVCNQIFINWKLQTMSNLQKKVWYVQRSMFESKNCLHMYVLNLHLPLQAWVEKVVHKGEAHWLCNTEKVPGTVISKEGHADNLLGYEKIHNNWCSRKRCSRKQCFVLPTTLEKITLFDEWLTHTHIRGAYDKFPDFFHIGTFIDSTHMKL